MSCLSGLGRSPVRLHIRRQDVAHHLDHHCLDLHLHPGDLFGGVPTLRNVEYAWPEGGQQGASEFVFFEH